MKGHKIRLPKKNKYQKTAEAILDLHGMYQVEAEEAVIDFLNDVKSRGCRFVRIIPGKGIHSADGYGVLNTLVREILSGRGYKFSSAKMNEGGEGALDIDLTK
ncbi:MAG: Smr/MutS family protein [Candidatus Falkowbacteria bacterium]